MGSKTVERVELRTERLLVRPFRLGDVDDIAAMGGFPRWDLKGPKPHTRRHAEEFVAQKVLDSWSTDPSFAIVVDGGVIGIVRLIINQENETAEFGYSLDERHWGKGITVEAARAVLSWAFPEFGLAKIWAIADVRNERSWRVMEKLGMTREGLSRSDRVIRGVRTAMVSYGILREEWDRQEVQPGG
jgi:RimJ/RimL family protein N-acetyltransferase